jgi:hypothetical protein
MIRDMSTVWLYAYSSNPASPSNTYYTVYTGGAPNGRAIFATVSLSYLTTISTFGAGARIGSVTPPFGPPAQYNDFAVNSIYAGQAIAVTFVLNARGAEAYAQGNVFYF